MVFPAQNSAVSSIVPSENLPLPETPESREEVSDLFLPASDQQKSKPEIGAEDVDKDLTQPGPGKVVDERNKKISDIPIQSPQQLTTIADREEEDFRLKEKKLKESDSTAHEQHS